ncbi:MAG: shikimate dehydrogenase [Crocosphaera sp.]
MNDPVTVTYSIAEVLKRIEDKIDKQQDKIDSNQKEVNQKLDKINERLTNLDVGVATLTEKTNGMDKRLEKVESEQAVIVKAISDLQGFRSLILPVIVGGMSAIIGGIVTAVFRWLFITPNP